MQQIATTPRLKFGEHNRIPIGIYLINGATAEQINDAVKLAASRFQADLENFTVSYHHLGNSFVNGIVGGIDGNKKLLHALELRTKKQARRECARGRYMRMCAKMPPPRQRKHGGRWPKRRRR